MNLDSELSVLKEVCVRIRGQDLMVTAVRSAHDAAVAERGGGRTRLCGGLVVGETLPSRLARVKGRITS